jgi:hypothetical protein
MRFWSWAIVGSAIALSGCTRNCPCATPAKSADTSASSASGAGPSGGPASPAAPGAAAAGTATPPGEIPPGAGTLPEVTIRNVGLHIGGGSTDESERDAFKRAIEARFEDFLRCYRMVVEPEKGGTFGIDLFIARAGGKPEVRQPRTAIKGAEFRECMLNAFSTVHFEKPKAGPTVISYSLKFELIEGSQSQYGGPGPRSARTHAVACQERRVAKSE